MASTPFAFSIHHFINSVGAYAGFAAIIGLAVLVLLFFAQARETHSLRQQASEADERAAQMESRLAWVTRQQSGATDATAQFPAPTHAAPAAATTGAAPPPTPTPTPAFAGAAAAAPGRSAGGAAAAPGRSAGGAAAAPGPPAGVAAPALAAATRLIPAVSAPSQLASPGAAAVAPPPTRSAPLASAPPRPAPGPASAYTAAPGDGATLAAPPPPATEAGGGNGEVRDRVYGAASARPVLPPPAQPEAGRSWVARVVAVFLGALVIAGIVVALLIVTSNNGTNSATSSAHATNASAAHRARRSPTFRPSSVTVAVLNGTGVAGLARRVATRLGTGGYKQGTVANASDQTNTATVVAYLPGHRADALRVASSLKLGSGAVQPVDASTQQIACPPGMTCAADVVVTVGTDLASQ